MGTELAAPHEPPLELVRKLCARAGLRLTDDDLAAVAATLAAHDRAFEQVRALDLPQRETGFIVAWQ